MKIQLSLKIILQLCMILRCFQQSHAQLQGSVSGKTIKVLDKYVFAYLGVPYAAPPVGELRFQEPKPVKPWNSIYNATKKSPSCMQKPSYIVVEWFRRHPRAVSEDCLYLNIWVPSYKADSEPFTTMVWIYGGAFNIGSSAMDIYDGAVLASLGNVIVVTFNYRGGAFGFANFDRENAWGNMGMLDQVMALKWVHRNVENFGGDRRKITIFGESAGSISIAHHLISPLTKGLFSRAILQSGSNYHELSAVNPDVNVNLTVHLSTELGCNGNDVLNCMREQNASKIEHAEFAYLKKIKSVISFYPQKGPPYLPVNPLSSIDSGKFHDVDVMMGSVKDEGSLFLALYRPEFVLESNPILTEPDARYILNKYFLLDGEPIDSIMKVYLGSVSEEDRSNVLKQIVRAMGDGIFVCPTLRLAEKLTRNNRKVYHYTFNHTQIHSIIPKWMGVPHFSDVAFVFGMPFVRKKEFKAEDLRFSRRIIELWTSFAKTGVPSYENMEHEWKPFDQEDRNSFYLTLGNFHPSKAEEEKCTFWKDFHYYN